jgi:hypothetical protein
MIIYWIGKKNLTCAPGGSIMIIKHVNYSKLM